MSLLTAESPVAATIDYCRRARRIRASLKRDPFLRHQALVDLARRRDKQARTETRLVSPNEGKRPTAVPVEIVEHEFKSLVKAKLQLFGFTFSDRLKLLDAAERMGISRFRANLMLATCEHQADRPPIPTSAKPKIPSLLIVLAMEAAVVGAVMWICAL